MIVGHGIVMLEWPVNLWNEPGGGRGALRAQKQEPFHRKTVLC